MKINKLAAITAATAVILSINSQLAMAQDAAPSPSPAATPAASPAANPDQNGRNRPSPEEFRQRMNERLKAALKATDEEWSVIQPLLEKVQDKQREAMTGRFGGFGGPGGFGGRRGGQGGQTAQSGSGGQVAADQGNGNRPDRPVPPEVQALRTALDSDSTAPADIKAKLQALRDARKKSAGELEQARQDLVKVLSQRQEATLVMMGVLE